MTPLDPVELLVNTVVSRRTQQCSGDVVWGHYCRWGGIDRARAGGTPMRCSARTRKFSKCNSLQGPLDDAKARPGKFNAAAGPAQRRHHCITHLQQKTGIRFNILVVDGSTDKVAALLGKQVDFGGSLTGVLPQVKPGQFKLSGAGGGKRTSSGMS